MLSAVYSNANKKLIFECPKGHVFDATFGSFKQGHRCHNCAIESRSGSNNPNWNPDLTEEERIIGRQFEGYRLWRKIVYGRSHYTCQCCGMKSRKLHAHHLESYKNNPALRLDINNGIALCIVCHQGFHAKYGNKNNTRMQFEEFVAYTTKAPTLSMTKLDLHN